MIGIIPSSSQTFEVYGDFKCNELVEGKLYYNPDDGRLYYYSKSETRSNPKTGYYPIWDGKDVYVTSFSNKKYFDRDVILMDIHQLSSNINKEIADQVRYNQRRADNDAILNPTLTDGDNFFTQCIKGVIQAKQITMVDLMDMACPPLTEKIVENSYASLMKITFMRMDKWNIWIDVILKLKYVVTVTKNGKQLIEYRHPEETYDTGIVSYDSIMKSKDDPLKRIIKILMTMERIDKTKLKSPEVDDYTINNMMTTINGSKPLSAQLFSRFIRMAQLSYTLKLYDGEEMIFEYKE